MSKSKTEMSALWDLIDELDKVRVKHKISFEYLVEVVQVMAEFGWETGMALSKDHREEE